MIDVYLCFFTLNILFDEVDRKKHEKKIIRYQFYRFFLKTATNDLH